MSDLRTIVGQFISGDCRFAPNPPRGFSGTRIEQVFVGGKVYCLRGWPPPGLATSRLQGLHRLLQWSSTMGIAETPLPLRNSAGRTLTVANGRRWQLEPWMPGGRCDGPVSEDALRAAVTWLARWHLVVSRFAPRTDEAEWFYQNSGPSIAVRERLTALQSWTPARQQQLLASVADCIRFSTHPPFVRAEESIMPMAQRVVSRFAESRDHVIGQLSGAVTWTAPIQPCLRDLWQDNILFVSDQVSGVVDLGATRSDVVSVDLARLLGSLRCGFEQSWHDVLDWYAAVRPLSLVERRLVGVVDRAAILLTPIAWLERIVASGLSVEGLPERVRERFEIATGRLERFVADRGDY